MDINDYLCKYCKINRNNEVTFGALITKLVDIFKIPVLVISFLSVYIYGLYTMFRDRNYIFTENYPNTLSVFDCVFQVISFIITVILCVVLFILIICYISEIKIANCKVESKK